MNAINTLTVDPAFHAAFASQDRGGEQMFDARALHGWLGVRDQFNQWVRRRVEEYGFEEGRDFSPHLVKTRGRPRQDYLITIDMAKELSMVERTERGRQTRRYFIEMEKAARQMAAELIEQGKPEVVPPVALAALEAMEGPRLKNRPHHWTVNFFGLTQSRSARQRRLNYPALLV